MKILKYLLVLAVMVALANPATADDLAQTTHVGHAVSAGSSHLRAVHAIEWPSGLTLQLSVNSHCVVADPADAAGCSFGNLSGLDDLQTAGFGLGYSRRAGPVTVRAIVDAAYTAQVETGSRVAIGAELRIEKDRLAGYIRYGTGLNDRLDPIYEKVVDDVHFGVAVMF